MDSAIQKEFQEIVNEFANCCDDLNNILRCAIIRSTTLQFFIKDSEFYNKAKYDFNNTKDALHQAMLDFDAINNRMKKYYCTHKNDLSDFKIDWPFDADSIDLINIFTLKFLSRE